MLKLNPLFIDVTWRWGGKSKDLTQEICINSQDVYGMESNMHMTCVGTKIDQINAVLKTAKKNNLKNILALRGDLPLSSNISSDSSKNQTLLNSSDTGFVSDSSCDSPVILSNNSSSEDLVSQTSLKLNSKMRLTNEFQSAEQLVKHIRNEFADYFCISVAGYPEGCVDKSHVETDIHILKRKVDAGADFVVSQLFYDIPVYMDWVKRCKDIGINVPIVPGIMPIQNYSGFEKMVKMCNIKVPEEIWTSLNSCKGDDLAVKDFGIQYSIYMIKTLVSSGIKGFHFYTLNLERSTQLVLEGLELVPLVKQPTINSIAENNNSNLKYVTSGFFDKLCAFNRQTKDLPWQPSPIGKRATENVRPIFWHNNTSSYIDRTKNWDEFPNGRWGDSRSPAFGELNYGQVWTYTKSQVINLWGTPTSVQDLVDLFTRYCQNKLSSLPWSDTELMLESNEIKPLLESLNKAGYLTINSQPSCNGVTSTNLVHGWGPKNGFVYKKAYIEFFIEPTKCEKLIKFLSEFNAESSESPMITYLAIRKDSQLKSNWDIAKPNAVSWGVFPGCEIIQPTIVDADSFIAWKDEAFDYFQLWSNSYGHNQKYAETTSLLNHISDTWYLMNLVDNNYTRSAEFMYNMLLSIGE
ncbi:Methylenetetrahydrofolate reductase 1 [Smittium culicis]|uniref:Methylenetetrahydrofolate reductase 1 n=1 Tax=Smittium culicis TaxID=133412 RepID=A0A1R1YRM4_9FUNG|nr:Methylenetetrahydrofolate reductase 1 [Smittium culicis]